MSGTETPLVLFALNASRAWGMHVANALRVPLAAHEEREFDSGEHKSRPLESVRDRDVYVIQSLHGDAAGSANDRLLRLLFFIGALRDAAAARITAVVPYLCYSRKDRKTKARDPVTTRYVAALFEAVGTHRIVTLDVHNVAAYQNAFRIGCEHLEAADLFIDRLLAVTGGRELVVISPDAGGMKRSEAFRNRLAERIGRPVDHGFMEKYRSSGQVTGSALVGELADRTALVIDDLIASGGTLLRAARACRAAGAREVWALASHGAFTAGAAETLADAALDRIMITDSITPVALHADKLDVLSCTELFAEAIRRMHEGGSLVELLAR